MERTTKENKEEKISEKYSKNQKKFSLKFSSEEKSFFFWFFFCMKETIFSLFGDSSFDILGRKFVFSIVALKRLKKKLYTTTHAILLDAIVISFAINAYKNLKDPTKKLKFVVLFYYNFYFYFYLFLFILIYFNF